VIEPVQEVSAAPSRPRGRLRATAQATGLVLGVLLAHLGLIGTWPQSAGHGRGEDAARPMQVRRLVQPALPLQPDAPARIDATEAQLRARQAGPVEPGARIQEVGAVEPAVRIPQPAATPRGPLPGAAPGPDATTLAAAQASPNPALPTPDPGGLTVPVYPTLLPPPTTLRYELRRGAAGGLAELVWRPAPERYELTLRMQGLHGPAPDWTSAGAFDAHGIAPLRFAEGRRGRELRAVNFQRAAGRITFSGPQLEYPLLAGAQDRLSWLLQLAGIVAADPALAQPGAPISLFVAGTRGDADVWTFTAIGTEQAELPAGAVPGALRLHREPLRPYDTQVDVWLDPRRHFLPVRLLLRVRATGEATELRLQEMGTP
jgi:hypothetical protein